MERPLPFPEAPHGYDREAVERFVEEAEREREELAGKLEESRRERGVLEREIAALRGELDATKAAMPEIGELQARLEGLEGRYAERVRALEALLAFAAREAAERRSEPAPAGDQQEANERAVIRGSWWATPNADEG